jgi:hypothetical protein
LVKPTQGHQQLTDRVVLFKRMTQRNVAMDLVAIATTLLGASHVARLDEVADDRLR